MENVILKEISKREELLVGIETKKASLIELENQVEMLMLKIEETKKEINSTDCETINAEIVELKDYAVRLGFLAPSVEEVATEPVGISLV